MAKYAWRASNSAPRGCLMEITSGGFVAPNGDSVYVPPGDMHKGWGEEVSIHNVGEETKPLPDHLVLTFYSFLEDKFYRGSFDLPGARIEQLFSEGYPDVLDATRRTTFTSIVAGVAPGGAVAVWVSGVGRQVEVFFGRAQEVALDWHKALGMPEGTDRKAFIAESLAAAAKTDPSVTERRDHVPFGLWDGYRERFSWLPVFENMAAPARIERVHYANGEREELPLPSTPAARPLPRAMHFDVPASNRVFDLSFEEDEVQAAFRRLGAQGERVELVFAQREVEGNTMFGVFVRNRRESLALTQGKRGVFSLR